MCRLVRDFSLLAFAALFLSACERKDPRYPVYYSYRVDVKVDGVPKPAPLPGFGGTPYAAPPSQRSKRPAFGKRGQG